MHYQHSDRCTLEARAHSYRGTRVASVQCQAHTAPDWRRKAARMWHQTVGAVLGSVIGLDINIVAATLHQCFHRHPPPNPTQMNPASFFFDNSKLLLKA
ncbi:hypothetical protein BaRGS_00001683 [Batillaria attramentaria]|uniref:Uncharacterized protein n=1 Tax=Batillaria attramentaria TaxID=370345 RepID=A0ABD0M6B6_9CAEN